ncbi:unnamed protein product [Vicia faba]|uniref:Endonuclease/exonuclease/phosphatase domain-containing protein n=1 Tax=Vicia faba TaxID=3906 RepID=A0AAV1BDX3_VICFA|nr:unnamed protein product [Vicia faba]
MQIKFDNEQEWNFTAIYASPHENNKNMLWEKLTDLAYSLQAPWMLVGDFNDISHVSEKRGGVLASLNICKRLRDKMDRCLISDVESRVPKFTSRGPVFHGGQHIYEKLDRVLSNDEWRMMFLEAYEKLFMRVEFSYHHQILVNMKEEFHNYVEKPFRFENVWLTYDIYSSMLKEAWREDNSLALNLKNVVEGIEKWKFNSFDKIKKAKKEMKRRLEGI